MSLLPPKGVKEDDNAQGSAALYVLVHDKEDKVGFDFGPGKMAVILPYPYKWEVDYQKLAEMAAQMVS